MMIRAALVTSALLLHAAGAAAQTEASGASCSVPAQAAGGADGARQITIDDAWSGASARFDAVARNDRIYVGYYDRDRWLSVVQYDVKSGRSCKARLDSRFAGWDAHNYVKLAFDPDGVLHVAGNMHSAPLVYGRADAPDSLQGLRLRPMVGRQEQHVTYPTFVSTGDRLLFFYRDGVSGNGVWYGDAFGKGAWRRVGDGPLFADSWTGTAISAYPTTAEVDAEGVAHFAVVWRRTPDVESNVAISYVATRDFATFFNARGATLRSPVAPEPSTLVDEPGLNGGLLNNARLSLDPARRPVVVYHRYGPDGRNEIVAARPDARGWLKTVVATAQKATVYKGRGSLPDLPVFSDVQFKGGKAFIRLRFAGEPWRALTLDPNTLEPAGLGSAPNVGIPPAPVAAPAGLRAPNQIGVPAPCADATGSKVAAVISYVAQSPNGDRPPNCKANASVCTPAPSPLVLKIAASNGPICPSR